MTYRDYRAAELEQALVSYHNEMEQIHVKRIDIMRQEIEAWKILISVILADNPEMLAPNLFKCQFNEDKEAPK